MPARYEIVVAGASGPLLRAALEGFDLLDCSAEQVRLVGAVADQSALNGVLHQLLDLQVDLLEVHRIGE